MSYQMRLAKAEYAGDPGLFSTIGKIGKAVLKIGKKVAPLVGVAGAVVGVASQIFKKPKGKTTLGLPSGSSFDPSMGAFAPQQEDIGTMSRPGTGIQVQFPRVGGVGGGGFQVGSFPAQAPVQPGQPMGTQMVPLPGGGAVARRCHANKSGYFTYSQGRAPEPIKFVAPGTKCVASRRMNPLNPRALHHAMTRIASAKRAASFLSRISIRSACKTRAPSRRRAHGTGCACKTCK
jgi:hypothetical protein